MCALVQAIRKIGIVGGGPGIGGAANPMHIVRTVGSPPSTAGTAADRPSTSSSDFDPSFGQRKRVVEDPSTQIDDNDGQRLPAELSYYTEENLDRHLSNGGTVRQGNGDDRLQSPLADVNRGKSFGRRKRQVQRDLEKGEQ